ncbi:hypothetical protein ABFV99_00435 [Cytobacillus horneckiae]|uniref:hypothetical protein n=1 Tax=Cytobacillus horneckiae TaxID=549687 RepID=UPI0034CF59CE
MERAKQVKVFYTLVDEGTFEYEEAYLFDFENCIAFDNGRIFMLKVIQNGAGIFEQDPNTNYAFLGYIEREDIPRKDYAERIIRHQKRMTIYDYIVQKGFYSGHDINWGLSNI